MLGSRLCHVNALFRKPEDLSIHYISKKESKEKQLQAADKRKGIRMNTGFNSISGVACGCLNLIYERFGVDVVCVD